MSPEEAGAVLRELGTLTTRVKALEESHDGLAGDVRELILEIRAARTADAVAVKRLQRLAAQAQATDAEVKALAGSAARVPAGVVSAAVAIIAGVLERVLRP